MRRDGHFATIDSYRSVVEGIDCLDDDGGWERVDV
jgi:hypothetical protein